MTATQDGSGAAQQGSERDAAGADHGLAEFGYSQSLDRSIGKFASFAAGVS
jgi:hypothetical protein